MNDPRLSRQEGESTFDVLQKKKVMAMEHQIAVEHKKIVRAKLKECILENFENANEVCYDLRAEYAALLRDRFGGKLFPEGLEPKNRLHQKVRFPDES